MHARHQFVLVCYDEFFELSKGFGKLFRISVIDRILCLYLMTES